MARTTINRLSDRRVKTTKTGMYADGGGLYLRVTEGGPGDDESPVLKRYWVMRYRQRATRKDRQLGIGPLDTVTLAGARTAANSTASSCWWGSTRSSSATLSGRPGR
jgi:Arm DNA-binding domain